MRDFAEKIKEIQERLSEQKLDGWLLYDHHGSNKFVRELLHLPPEILLSRRFFYWIPAKGDPVKIVHKIEGESLEKLVGASQLYLSWAELEEILFKVIKKAKRIAMEYSPKSANPYVSVVDAGVVELIRERGIEIASSDWLLQHFTSVLDEKQIETHIQAAAVLEKTVELAWDMIAGQLRKGKKITEFDVQQFILSEFLAAECVTEGFCICAGGPNTSFPHYVPSKKHAREIVRGDFVLLDLWCKKDVPHGVFADITRVGVVGPEPTPREQEIFDIVKKAQAKATKLIKERFEERKQILGSEVDDVCRKVIKEAGYGAYFTHRTGHSIDTSLHGGGAHLDNFETKDHRKLLPGTVFSVEPGIYLPGELGVRLEYDILIKHDSSVHITGGIQENIVCLL